MEPQLVFVIELTALLILLVTIVTVGRRAARRKACEETPTETVVVFTVPEKRLSAMNVAAGPCVPLPERKHALRSVHTQQGPERIEQMLALFVVLGGSQSRRSSALQLVSQEGPGRLYRCSDEFVGLMADKNRELVRLGAEDKAKGDKNFTQATAESDRVNAAWLANGKWHKVQVKTDNRLHRIGWARIAQEKGQPLFAWYGPPVPEYVVVTGYGPYPGKTSVEGDEPTDRGGDESR